MRSAPELLAAVVALLAMAGCTRAVSRAEASDIARETRPILKAMCSRGGELTPESWPASLRALEPEQVRITAEGLYARTMSSFASERGVFVPCHPDRFDAQGRVEPSYRAIGDGVYTYYIAG